MTSSPRLANTERGGKNASGARAQQKGLQTKQLIVDAALGLAGQIGLEGLSIGVLAVRGICPLWLARGTADFGDSRVLPAFCR
ncbi:MAG: hypothetical protein RLZZ371_2065 [Pseudomonadota bacterium]